MTNMDWGSGVLLAGSQVRESIKTLEELKGIFADDKALREMDPRTVVYRVQAWCPVPEGTEGGLFWGTTAIEPGQVGTEYFMTHGHFHLKRDRTECYATLAGEGALLLMDESRKMRTERMSAGSLHFIPPHAAHRVANVGNVRLRFVACWPSDAGHDYESVRRYGFAARLLCIGGQAKLVGSGE
jgi:glucose-6-phosphate isomerase, archaeal